MRIKCFTRNGWQVHRMQLKSETSDEEENKIASQCESLRENPHKIFEKKKTLLLRLSQL